MKFKYILYYNYDFYFQNCTLYIAVYILQFWEKVLSWDIRYKLRIVKYKFKIITLNLGTVGLWTEVH